MYSGYQNPMYFEMPYTYFHWRLSEQIFLVNQESIVDGLSEEDIQLLLLNIFPELTTFFHRAFDIEIKKKLELENKKT